jgi:glycine cleavage system H protein
MLAVLALLTFFFFISLDYVLNRRREEREAQLPAPHPADLREVFPLTSEPVWVAGYEMPEHLHYHSGHTWVRVLSPDLAAVGVDDFARRLMGKADHIRVPRPGTEVVQGAPGFTIASGPRLAAFSSPVGGSVVEVNPEIERRPEVCSADPYGRGWLFKVRTSHLAANLRNLLGGRLARKWMEDAREQLELRLMALSGSVLQDGGEPAPDFAAHLDPADWNELAETFLLSVAEPTDPSAGGHRKAA